MVETLEMRRIYPRDGERVSTENGLEAEFMLTEMKSKEMTLGVVCVCAVLCERGSKSDA